MKFIIIFLCILSISGCQNDVAVKKVDETDVFYEQPVIVANYSTSRETRQLIFSKKPKRVIAYHQNNIEMLFALREEQSLIAGLGRFIAVSDEERQTQSKILGKFDYYGLFGINQEQAVWLQPDFILGWPSSFAQRGVWSLGTTDFWQSRGVNCYMAYQLENGKLKESMEGECKYILDIGKAFNKETEAQVMVQKINDHISSTIAKNKGKPRQKALVLDFVGNTIVNYGDDRLASDMIRKLGGEVAALNSRISKEDILWANPDVIFIIYKNNEDFVLAENFQKDRIYASLDCVKNKRVYPLPLTYVYNSGLKTLAGLKLLAQGLYPET